MLKILKNFTILIILLTMALIQLILKIITTTIYVVKSSIEKIYKKIKRRIVRKRNETLKYLYKLSEV